MKRSLKNHASRKLYLGLAYLVSSSMVANADIQGKQVLQTGNNPYGWSNLPSIVSNVTDTPANQIGSYSNSFRVRCYFSNLSIENTNSYTMNVFNESGQIYGSTKVPTNGRAQCDLFIGSPSISNPLNYLNESNNLYLAINSTNGLAYALSFTGLTANAGQNITLSETNSLFSSASVIGSIDSDGDRFRNDEEIFVGTDSYNANDYFKITHFSPNGAFLNIRWSGSSNTLVDITDSLDIKSTNSWNFTKRNVFNNSATLTNWDVAKKYYKIQAKGKIQ